MDTAIFWPMIAHVVLVFVLYVLLSKRRFAAVRGGRAKVEQFRDMREEPAESLPVRNNLANQFELPVLFYVVCIVLYLVDADSTLAVVMAWLFVAARYGHAYVHVTGNRLRHRRPAFIAGFVVLGLLWAWLAAWMAFA